MHLFLKYFFVQQFNQVLEGAPLDQKGNLDYSAFTRIIKRGKQDDEWEVELKSIKSNKRSK